MTKLLSPAVLENIFKYSGLTGVILLFLYLPFKNTIDKRFFTSLTQRRKTVIIITSLFSIWSIGVLVIVLSFAKAAHHIAENRKGFIYSGQIVNDEGKPLHNAYAYVVIGHDTIKAETPTGLDGTFVIRLDTTQGIQATVYYGHPAYGSDTRFRSLTQSVPEQFFLKKNQQLTFSTNLPNTSLNSTIVKQTGLQYGSISPTYTIYFLYNKTGIDSFDGRYRYLGGKVQVYINGTFCCQSQQLIQPTHSAGNKKDDLEAQLKMAVRDIVNKEMDRFTQNIATCIGTYSH